MLEELFSIFKKNIEEEKDEKYLDTLINEVEQKEENINLKNEIYDLYHQAGNVSIKTEGFVFAHNSVINFFDIFYKIVMKYLKEEYYYYNKLKAYQIINEEYKTKLLIHLSVMNDLLNNDNYISTYPTAREKISIEKNILLSRIIISLIIEKNIQIQLREEDNYYIKTDDEIEKEYEIVMKDLENSHLLDEIRIDNNTDINVVLERIDIYLTQYFSELENRKNYILDLDNQLNNIRRKAFNLEEEDIDTLLELTNICISKYRLAQKYIDSYENRVYKIILENKFKLLLEYPKKIKKYSLQDDYLGEEVYINKISSKISKLKKHYGINPILKKDYSYKLFEFYLNNNESNIKDSTFLLSLLSALEKGEYAIYQFYNTEFSEKEILEAETGIKQRRIKKEGSILTPYISFIKLLSLDPFYAKVDSISYYNSLELKYKDRWISDYSRKKCK